MKLTYWQILLIEQRNLGKKGFAIPYIIGSQKYLPENHSYQGINELIIDIVKNNLLVVFVKYCWETKDLILEIKNKNAVGVFPLFNNRPQKKLCISSFNNDFGETVELIIKTFIEKCQHYIDTNLFSINNGVRTDFLLKEVEQINDWFSKIDNELK